MRRLLAIAIGVLTLCMGLTAPSSAASCTKRGTSEPDFIHGTWRSDVICARGSGDYVTGRQGRDVLRGGPANDTLVGGEGRDRIRGRGGADKLFAVDGGGGDVLRGGPGLDHCYGEKHDRFRGCEQRHTNRSPTYPLIVVMALTRALERTVQAANHQICVLSELLCIATKG